MVGWDALRRSEGKASISRRGSVLWTSARDPSSFVANRPTPGSALAESGKGPFQPVWPDKALAAARESYPALAAANLPPHFRAIFPDSVLYGAGDRSTLYNQQPSGCQPNGRLLRKVVKENKAGLACRSYYRHETGGRGGSFPRSPCFCVFSATRSVKRLHFLQVPVQFSHSLPDFSHSLPGLAGRT